MGTVCCQGKTFQSINAILFDKDGTLAQVEDYLIKLGFVRSQLIAQASTADRKASSLAIESQILATFGLSSNQLNPAGLLAVGSRYDNEIAAAACLAANGYGWISAVKIAYSAFAQAADTLSPKVIHTPLLPHARQLLKQIEAAGIATGIVSSDLHSEVTSFIAHHQLTEVDWHCGFSADTLRKTHSDFLQFACEEMSVKANEILIIGDSAADYELSKQGSAGFLGMTGGWSKQPVMASEITTCSELNQIKIFK
ncbi:MAG: HAD-IA family hydrolase [Cyanobacteria bacterium J06621_11]